MEYIDKVQELVEIVNGVLGGSVSLPETNLYYINYRLRTNTWKGQTWLDTEEEFYMGPYPFAIAQIIAQDLVPTKTCYVKDKQVYATKASVTLKPRRNSTQEPGPSQWEIEQLLVKRITNELDAYRRVQEWFSLGYAPPHTTKKRK